MTLAPRSWPSCPIFATRMRGRRPCVASKVAAAVTACSISAAVGPYSFRYEPDATECTRW